MGGSALPFAIVGIVLLLVSPIVAQAMQFAISRQREFLADAEAINLTRYPPGLINALEKLQEIEPSCARPAGRRRICGSSRRLRTRPRRVQRGGSKSGTWLNRMFETHPPLEKRIEALHSIAGMGPAPHSIVPPA